MRFKVPLTLALFALLSCAAAARAQEQPQDQKVIDDFVTTRGVSFDEPTHTSTAPKQTTHASTTHKSGTGSVASKGHGANSSGGSVASNKNSPSTANSSKKNNDSPGKGSEVAAQSGDGGAGAKIVNASAMLRPIGLGYTVFMKDKAGGLLPADPSQEYHSGDRIAVALEPNTEGYIYVFNAANDRDPVMLFPNAALDSGANVAHAHVRETYPTDVNYAFEFDQTPAVEYVYVVVSRSPLEGVPTGDALVEACKKCDEYGWRPTAAQWQRIKAGAVDKHVFEAKNTQLAQLQKQPVQPASLQRGIKIKREDPAPAIVRVNDSPDADTLVTVIKLVHK